MSANQVVQLAAKAGRIILENGGEVYRVEETVNRVCVSFGVKNSSSYATPTVLIVSVVDRAGENHSYMERITSRQVNLDKIDAVNRFSRRIESERPSLEEAEAMLEEVAARKAYKNATLIVFSGLACAAFALVFQGGPRDLLPAFLIGALMRYCVLQLARIRLNDFFINLIGSFIATVMGWFMVLVGLGQNADVISISTLMLLVPGLLLTNAVRDMAAGDLISSVSRLTEAFFIAIALACGAALSYGLISLLGGGGL